MQVLRNNISVEGEGKGGNLSSGRKTFERETKISLLALMKGPLTRTQKHKHQLTTQKDRDIVCDGNEGGKKTCYKTHNKNIGSGER